MGTETLTTFMSDGVTYELQISSNKEGPEAPCVGVAADVGNSFRTVMACPTEEAEEGQYASALDFDGEYFVVGYGLAQGDEVRLEKAANVVITDEIQARRYFAVQLEESPGTEPFQIPITASDGTTRSITSHGISG